MYLKDLQWHQKTETTFWNSSAWLHLLHWSKYCTKLLQFKIILLKVLLTVLCYGARALFNYKTAFCLIMFRTVIELNSSIFSVTWSLWNIFNMCSLKHFLLLSMFITVYLIFLTFLNYLINGKFNSSYFEIEIIL